MIIEKYDPRKIISVVYFDAGQAYVYLKRFQIEETDKKTSFIGDHPDSRMMQLSLDYRPMLEVIFDEKKNEKDIENIEVDVEEFILIKGYKAKGKRLSNFAIKKMNWLDPLPYDPPEPEPEDEDVSFDEAIEDNIDDEMETPEVNTEEVIEKNEGTEEEVDDALAQVEKPAKKKDPPPTSDKKAQETPMPEATDKKKKTDESDKKQMSLFD
jgi:topoisomerase-4 subunit A